jgi:hypothetical protein
MLGLADDLGFTRQDTADSGVVRVSRDLDAPRAPHLHTISASG